MFDFFGIHEPIAILELFLNIRLLAKIELSCRLFQMAGNRRILEVCNVNEFVWLETACSLT